MTSASRLYSGARGNDPSIEGFAVLNHYPLLPGFARALSFGFLALASVSQAQTSEFSERVVTRVDGISIEADPADGDYVRALIARLQAPAIAAPSSPNRFGLSALRAQRDPILGEIAAGLALPRPTPLMAEVFDKFSFGATGIHDAMLKGRPGGYALWRKPDLVARLRAGQVIPGFTLDGNDVQISINASFQAPPDTPAVELAGIIAKAWRQIVWPVNIGLTSPEADIANSLAALEDFRAATTGAEPNAVMNVLHETVEATLISQYLHSPDRRWFCEAVANHLALDVIRRRVGSEQARQYYDVDKQLAAVGKGDLLALERWPAAESSAARHYPSEINQANYVRATWVIEQAAARHGAELLPRWMAEIGRTPASKASIQTVYAAYRKVTGEDLRAYLQAE
jgi:hypothetical protein